MAFQFPASPAVNQTFTPVAGTTYRWSGTAWHLLAGPGAFITQAEGDARYLQQAGADALYVNVNEVANISNRIINGKFAIDQRNAGAAVTVAADTNRYGVDRWLGQVAVAGSITLQQSAAPVAGRFMGLVTAATANASPAAASFATVQQNVEGYNLADLSFGTSSATAFTLAFDITSSVAATLPVAFRNFDGTRSYVTTFAASPTLTTVAVTVPGDTGGTWNRTNGVGLFISFPLVAGATYVTSANAWQAGNFMTAAGCTNLMATAGNYLMLGNVRLYKGSVDFGPDRRLYAEELALCQRYYCKTFRIDVVPGPAAGIEHSLQGKGVTSAAAEPFSSWVLPVRMRAIPTVTLYNLRAGGAAGQWSNGSQSADSAGARAVGVSDWHVPIDNAGATLSTENWFIAATASAEL